MCIACGVGRQGRQTEERESLKLQERKEVAKSRSQRMTEKR